MVSGVALARLNRIACPPALAGRDENRRDDASHCHPRIATTRPQRRITATGAKRDGGSRWTKRSLRPLDDNSKKLQNYHVSFWSEVRKVRVARLFLTSGENPSDCEKSSRWASRHKTGHRGSSAPYDAAGPCGGRLPGRPGGRRRRGIPNFGGADPVKLGGFLVIAPMQGS